MKLINREKINEIKKSRKIIFIKNKKINNTKLMKKQNKNK